MRKQISFGTLAAMIFVCLIAFVGCKKDDMSSLIPEKKTRVYLIQSPDGTSGKSMKTKSTKAELDEIINGDTLHFTGLGIAGFKTDPAVPCTWVESPGTSWTNADQIFPEFTAYGIYQFVINGTGVSMTFYVDIDSAYVPPAGQKMRIVSRTINGGNWDVLIRFAKQCGPGSYSNSYAYGTGLNPSTFTTPVQTGISNITSDSIDITMPVPITTNGRVTIIPMGISWFHAAGSGSIYYDETFPNSTTPDDVFSFFMDGSNGEIEDADHNVVFPGGSFSYPGAGGDEYPNPVIVRFWYDAAGDLHIYVASPVGTTLRVCSTNNDSYAETLPPTPAWTEYTTTVATGFPTFSEMEIYNFVLAKYNWFQFGTGSGASFVANTTLMDDSKSWKPAAGACQIKN